MIGVALPLVHEDLGHKLTWGEEEIATSVTTIGAIFGSLGMGLMADRWGRRWCIFISDIL